VWIWDESVHYFETFFDPFYSRARRWAGIGPAILDVFVETGATATVEGSGWLVITRPVMGDEYRYATPSSLDRARLDGWVAEFNRRASENRGPARNHEGRTDT